MAIRTIIRGVGKALICVGILLFLFVGYQLWGTGIAEQRGQKELEKSFNRRLTPLPTLPGADPSGSAPATVPIADLGGGVAIIEIPKIDVKKFVVEGVEVEDLKNGPGHYPGTAMPGEKGNSAIAGHRTTYGAPFYNLNELVPGDPIFVTTPAGRFRYDVMEDPTPVSPDAVHVLNPTEDDRLTLTTCHPRFSAAERLIVTARLVTPPAATTTRPPPTGETSASIPAASLDAGLSGGHANKGPAILWGAIAAAVWIGGWLLGRAWRRWPAYAVATVPFLLVLFVFYENVARLLPANV